MPIVNAMTFCCPACSAQGQHFLSLTCLDQVAKTKCKKCGSSIKSRITSGKHMVLIIYDQAFVVVLGLPLIAALISETWCLATVCIAAFMILAVPPALVLHARSPELEADKRIAESRRSYGRKNDHL